MIKLKLIISPFKLRNNNYIKLTENKLMVMVAIIINYGLSINACAYVCLCMHMKSRALARQLHINSPSLYNIIIYRSFSSSFVCFNSFLPVKELKLKTKISFFQPVKTETKLLLIQSTQN